jgi:hypothetical protein
MRTSAGTPSAKYLHAGIIAIALSGASAVYLNFEGARCLGALSRETASYSQDQIRDETAKCFLVTNSYVYSLFGIVVGVILLLIWTSKRRGHRDVA